MPLPKLVLRIPLNNRHSKCLAELLEHNDEGTSLAICIHKGRDGRSIIAGGGDSLVRKEFDDLLEIFASSTQRDNLASEDAALGSLKRSNDTTLAIANNIVRKSKRLSRFLNLQLYACVSAVVRRSTGLV